MPFNLSLSSKLQQQGLKVKIFDRERGCEEPHLTVVWKTNKWRISLRSQEFMDAARSWRDLPKELKDEITLEANWSRLRLEWDRMFPDNPIIENENDEDYDL